MAGSGHDAYLYTLDQIVLPQLAMFQPQLIIIAFGYDANALDPLARIQLHNDSFRL